MHNKQTVVQSEHLTVPDHYVHFQILFTVFSANGLGLQQRILFLSLRLHDATFIIS